MRILLLFILSIFTLKGAVYVEDSRLQTTTLLSVVYSSGIDYKYEFTMNRKPLGDNIDLKSFRLYMGDTSSLWGYYSNVTYNLVINPGEVIFTPTTKASTFTFGFYSTKSPTNGTALLETNRNSAYSNTLIPTIPEPENLLYLLLTIPILIISRRRYV